MKVASPVRRAAQGNPPRRKAGRAPWSDPYTKLHGPVKWTYYYLYVILDIYSRYAVGWMLATRESAALAEKLIADTAAKQGISRGQLTLHADSKYVRCQVFPSFVTLTPIDPRGYRGVGGVLAAS